MVSLNRCAVQNVVVLQWILTTVSLCYMYVLTPLLTDCCYSTMDIKSVFLRSSNFNCMLFSLN